MRLDQKEQMRLIKDAIKRDHRENDRGAAIIVVVCEESRAEEVEEKSLAIAEEYASSCLILYLQLTVLRETIRSGLYKENTTRYHHGGISQRGYKSPHNHCM
jgi:hypothetical protein